METQFIAEGDLCVAFWKVSRPGKPWLVMVHGLQNNKASFDALINSDVGEQFSILATDLVGFGESSKPEYFPYTLNSQADVIEKVLNHEGIESFNCVGHSMGGMIGTILSHTMKGRMTSFVSMEGNLVYEDCGESAKSSDLPWSEFEAEYYPALKARIAASSDPSASVRTEAMKQISAEAFYYSAKSIVSWCKSQKLSTYFENTQCSTMMLVGDKGAFVSKPANTQVIEGSGHFMLQDQPERTLEKLRAFYA